MARQPAGSPKPRRTAEHLDRLPLRLIQIATDVLRREGRVTYIDQDWITLHLSLTPSPSRR